MRVAAVDIGTNSVRLLVLEQDGSELEMNVTVVGLGRGVDHTGRLSDAAVERTLRVLDEYRRRAQALGVDRLGAVATSASRDAVNRDDFFDRAEGALGVRPDLISGTTEAELTFEGAVGGLSGPGPFLVIDIGGGSTEFALGGRQLESAASVDVGSVRLTERWLPDRPAPHHQLEFARERVEELLAIVQLPRVPQVVVGVAGAFTSLAAIHLELEFYDRTRVHHARLKREDLLDLVEDLAELSVEETAALPSLDPARAPVILAGALIAEKALAHSGAGEVVVSEEDLLTALARRLQQV